MVESQKENKFNTKPTIVRQGHLAEKIVFVDGQPGCGKTMLSPIISALDRVELLTYAFEVEFICRLFYLNKIDSDASIAMVSMLTDHKLYQTMMGRETNFRYSDLSSVFRDAHPGRYIKRIFQKGDMAIPDRINKINPILNLTTHDLLGYSWPIFNALNQRAIIIDVVRHPLYMLIQQTLNFENLLSDPRDIQIYIKYKGEQLPYFSYKWEDLFVKSNAVEKSIYSMEKGLELSNKTKIELNKKYGNQILTIPFENFVIDPMPFMKKIEYSLGTKITPTTKRVMKKQKVPRKKLSDGIPLKIYKRCGWEPPDKIITEKQELKKRREFAVSNGAGKKALEVLDKLCASYESEYFKF